MRNRCFLVGLPILSILAALGWWQRQPLQAWWHVRDLAHASEASREVCVARVVALDEAALPQLLDGLTTQVESACANLEAALYALAVRWQTSDSRPAALLDQLHSRFGSFSPAGQAAALRVATGLLNQSDETKPLPVPIAQAAGKLLDAGQAHEALRPQVLLLGGALIARAPAGQWLDVCRNLAVAGLHDAEPKTRVAALLLTMREIMQSDSTVLNEALPLLHDPEPAVRRAALLALGRNQELVSEDDLLPLLHDVDADVRQTCELTLRGRGLHDRQLELARLISDESPVARLQILQHLRGGSDVEPGVWLRRLSQDPAAAVRAAAVRAAAAQSQVNLRDRLQEMTQKDVSPTVRELAAHYLAASGRN